jgi:hypothetical protein
MFLVDHVFDWELEVDLGLEAPSLAFVEESLLVMVFGLVNRNVQIRPHYCHFVFESQFLFLPRFPLLKLILILDGMEDFAFGT